MSSADPGSKGFSPEWNIGYSGGEDFILFPRLGRGEKEDKIVGRKSKREREIQMINTLKSDLEFATIYTVSRVLEEEIVQFLSGQFWKGIFQFFFLSPGYCITFYRPYLSLLHLILICFSTLKMYK